MGCGLLNVEVDVLFALSPTTIYLPLDLLQTLIYLPLLQTLIPSHTVSLAMMTMADWTRKVHIQLILLIK